MDCPSNHELLERRTLIQLHRCVVGVQEIRGWPIRMVGGQPPDGNLANEATEEPKIDCAVAFVVENRLGDAYAVDTPAPVEFQTDNTIVERPVAELAEAEAV